jgi:hypothetical protein
MKKSLLALALAAAPRLLPAGAPPEVEAGPDRLVVLPAKEVVLRGAARSPSGGALSFRWGQTAGRPLVFEARGAEARVRGIQEEGIAVFELSAADAEERTAADTVRIYTIRPGGAAGTVTGERKRWHSVTVTVEGPASAEAGSPNPFTDHRLEVLFVQGERTFTVPGFYAADGDAGETGAEAGNRWRAHFVPDTEGAWRYAAFLVSGYGHAVGEDPAAGRLATFSGEFSVGPTDKTGADHRAKGFLRHDGGRYLRFAGTGEAYLKGGADSPENFLAYSGFDGTWDADGLDREGEARGGKFLHEYAPHVRDWREGDPTWRGGKGKGIVGALNYLASKGMNSAYFLTMNVGGDGKDVWPWTAPGERRRFDVSKLDQWEVVFSHMDRLGILLHAITQETENDQLLDGGALGADRRLYYRELIARFGHHLAIVWNLGEENTNTPEERKAFARFIRDLDPYDHPIVVHTFPGKYDEVYEPLLGFPAFDGPSLQTLETHDQTLRWVERSAAAGRSWFVCLDEVASAEHGVLTDAEDPGHDDARKRHLWGNLMAGGAGVEWYFGYRHPHNDLTCEDWRSRDRLWDMTRHALEFFRRRIPFERMAPRDDLLSGAPGYCLAEPGKIYAVFLTAGGRAVLDLGAAAGKYTVRWYDPREGGDLRAGSADRIRGPGKVPLGDPPARPEADWAAVVKIAE